MDFLNDIKEKTVIVCPVNVKSKILDEVNKLDKLINIKIYSLDDLKKNIYFDYDCDAILYLMEKYNYTYEVSKNYIENLYFIEDSNYCNAKLDFLVSLKNELILQNLLIFNPIFTRSYEKIPFIVYGYDYLTSFDKKILSNFKYKVINKKQITEKKPVYKFITLEEEVLFVINKILDLLRDGKNINNIYLLNLDSDYNTEIIRLFNMFNLPVDLSKNSNVLSTIIGKTTFDYLNKTKSFEDTLEFIKSFNLDNPNNLSIYKTYLSIFNKYVGLDYSIDVIISAIYYELKNTIIETNNFKNKIRVGSLSNSVYSDSDSVFMMGFNQGSIPKVFKDEDYISDSLKKLINLDSVNDINKYEREAALNNIKSIKNLVITYKENYLDNEFYPSNLLSEKLFEEKSGASLASNGSIKYSNIKLSMMLDELIKYDKKDEELPKYFNSFDIHFMEYDNTYKKISKQSLYKYLDNKLTLSYTTIDAFYRCQFRYYLENILKLNKYEETFDTLVGSLFHYVLSHFYDEDFDLNKYYDYFLKDKELSNKEKFYLNKLKKELIIICDRLKDFQQDTGLTNVFTEKNIKIDKSSNIEVIFKGIVDKIMYKEYDGKKLISIIDYKTGSADIDLYNSIYGIGMQLIIYLYLITKSNLFDNYFCVGFYLQKILSNEVNIEKDKTYLDIKKENLKLMGYSIDEISSLGRFDPTYENSQYIKSLKTTKTGYSLYSKILDEETMKEFTELVDVKINEARDKILNCDFSINPKWISNEKESIGCKYCKFQDICNKKNEDIVNLKKYKDFSFLKEGDLNA